MIKFDEKGQAFWDFILENCSTELIQSVKEDVEPIFSTGNNQIEILGVRNSISGRTSVYLKTYGSIIIHTEFKSDIDGRMFLNRDSMSLEDFRFLKGVLKDV